MGSADGGEVNERDSEEGADRASLASPPEKAERKHIIKLKSGAQERHNNSFP